MTRQRLQIILCVLSLITWGMLLWFLNGVYPTTWSTLAFLAIVAIAVLLTIMPLSLWLTYHWGTSRGVRGDSLRALRHGVLIGGLTACLLGLRILRLLTVTSALLVVGAVIIIEVIAQLKAA